MFLNFRMLPQQPSWIWILFGNLCLFGNSLHGVVSGAEPDHPAAITPAAATSAAKNPSVAQTETSDSPVWSPSQGQPLLQKYCVACHNSTDFKGSLDLSPTISREEMLQRRDVWQEVLRVVREQEMPPQQPLPSAEERQQLTDWLDRAINDLDWTKLQQAGHVTFSRLTKDEYNNTMRDLLGLDLKPGDRLGEDGQGESGFVNDRDALYLTPAQLEKYLAAADQSLAAVLALNKKPITQHLESEAMFMTETKETPRAYGNDFLGYVLNRGQMTLYESVSFPHDGFYRFTIRARSTAGPTAALLRINDRPMASIQVPDMTPAEYSAVCFVSAGSHQMTWNVNKPPAQRGPQKNDGQQNRQPGKSPSKQYRALPENAGQIVNRDSVANAPRWPVRDNEPAVAKREIDRLNAAAVSVQRPIEWLRLLGTEGDPKEMQRFRSYVVERTAMVDQAKQNLAQALKIRLQDVDQRFQQHNQQRLQDNEQLFQRAGMIVESAAAELSQNQPLNPGDVSIDWIEITGPVAPEDKNPVDQLLIAEPGDVVQSNVVQGEDRVLSEVLTAEQAATQVIIHFASRSFRRPVDQSDVTDFVQLFNHATQRGDDYPDAIRLALSAVLVSPRFLYRGEQSDPPAPPANAQPQQTPSHSGDAQMRGRALDYPVDEFELASRLSYFLWLSMPDQQLFELAGQGQLRNPDVLAEQVGRLLADEKSGAFSEAFTGQWLGIASLGQSVFPDAKLFPEFTPELAADMKLETVLMFEHLLQNQGRVDELLTSNQTFLNARLARHYGLRGVQTQQLQLTSTNDSVRGGLLGMGSVLTATSSPSRTSPVVRGKWVLETLLGQPAGDPPADAGTLPGNAGQTSGTTLREELEQHRRNPSCATCHDKIDPLGFGLENFDAIGRFRIKENGKPIDASGQLPNGTSFVGAAELKTYLLQHRKEDFVRNVAERLLSFGLGRKLQFYDEAAIQSIVQAAANNNNRLDAMVIAVVQSYPFQHQGPRAE